ncbi:MAG TPA: ANTAR domain-containing protein [Pseudonocardiaceae bacterium]|nr:ANTAR domain-containing protein [Pseudonocardiaceae bacterium]
MHPPLFVEAAEGRGLPGWAHGDGESLGLCPGGVRSVGLSLGAADIATLTFLGVRTEPGDRAWLDHSLHGHAEIHQATGVVVAQLGVSATNALTRMRAYAFVEQRLRCPGGCASSRTRCEPNDD